MRSPEDIAAEIVARYESTETVGIDELAADIAVEIQVAQDEARAEAIEESANLVENDWDPYILGEKQAASHLAKKVRALASRGGAPKGDGES